MEQHKRIVLLVIVDTIAAILAILAAILIRLRKVPDFEDIVNLGAVRIILFVVIGDFLSVTVAIYKNSHE